MRAAVQRVHEANVTVDGQVVGSVSQGLLVYAGVAVNDTEADARYIAEKVAGLRIFNDPDGRMNLNVSEVGGGVLVISAFTLQADARKGRRPSFDAAAGPELALNLYERLCELLVGMGLAVAKGVFRAHMEVNSINDGPICVLLDSKRTF